LKLPRSSVGSGAIISRLGTEPRSASNDRTLQPGGRYEFPAPLQEFVALDDFLDVTHGRSPFFEVHPERLEKLFRARDILALGAPSLDSEHLLGQAPLAIRDALLEHGPVGLLVLQDRPVDHRFPSKVWALPISFPPSYAELMNSQAATGVGLKGNTRPGEARRTDNAEARLDMSVLQPREVGFVLTLYVFKRIEQRLGGCGWQMGRLQACNQRPLVGEMPLALPDMPPDHLEFGLIDAHAAS
jgi:hypothetical protein